MKKILAPVDFSDATTPVLRTAADLALALGGELRLVHVYHPLPVAPGLTPADCGCVPVFPTADEIARELATRNDRLNKLAETLRGDNLAIGTMVVRGEPTETILRELETFGADFLVLGSHGHGSLYHLLMGGVADALLKRAPCPVLLVRADRPGKSAS